MRTSVAQRGRGEADFRPDARFFEGRAEPLGGESVSLDLAGIGIRFEGLDARTAALLRSRFSGYLGEAPGAVRVRAATAGVASFLRPIVPAESYRLECRAEGAALLVVSYGFAARWLPAARAADLRLAPEPEAARGLSLENLVRVLVSWRAVEEGGVLLHSAGIERDGRAYGFFGPSGAGKTTLCRLSEGRGRVLNDDLLLLRRAAGGWEAAALPLTGHYGRGAGLYGPGAARGSWPLAGLYRLVQAPEVGVEELSAAVSVGEVVASVPFLEERPAGAALLDVVEGLVREVPVRRLRFRKDPAFWEAVAP